MSVSPGGGSLFDRIRSACAEVARRAAAVRIDDDGTHWIVDYKTSTHEGGSLEGFLAAEADRYREQLARYAALYRAYSAADVRCALYFPLLRAFIEVELES